ncbi:hypothetical protein GCM10009836_50170 [Pseudonocardia ailaonensis]|uniref:Secreted protein n=1 Tax=Pseudonocardia ailaonensis TaxID=367279 RepID=A0ABN2NEC6_9PSEU
MKRWMGGTIAAVVVAGGIAAGTGVALADPGTPPSSAAPAAKPDKVCTERIPKALARIDKLSTRIGGDASTKGSTAWLQDRAQKARSSGHTALADLLDQRAADRPQRTQQLATLKTQLLDVQKKDCGS